MASIGHDPALNITPKAQFRTTHWSVVLDAAHRGSPRAEEALATLCRTYWYPLYAFIRRRGELHEQAEDLTQEFFARLLDKNYLAGIQVQGGKFRSYLLTLLKHFLANEHERAHAQKRGGERIRLTIDSGLLDARYEAGLVESATPESLFERHWALTLLDQVMAKLQGEHLEGGKAELFALLQPCLSGAERTLPYSELGSRLGLTEGNVKVAVHRLRKRYGQLLREEIADTVSSPTEIEGEIRHLIAVSSG